MKLAIVLLLALYVMAAAAVTIEYDADEKAKCEAEGGCHVLTLRSLEQLFRKAFAAGLAGKCGV